MLYDLFTRSALSLALLPLACAGLAAPWLAAWLMGASIRRTGDARRTRRLDNLLRLAAHLLSSLALIATYIPLVAPLAVRAAPRGSPAAASPLLLALAGGPDGTNRPVLLIFGAAGLGAVLALNLGLGEGLRPGGFLRERVDRRRQPPVVRGSLGSAHLCTLREFARFRRADPAGMPLYGAFWGADQVRLDWDQGVFRLSGEDIARGVLTLGGPGSGKTQGVILPAIADRMAAGHSLIVADPQGELTPVVQRLAAVTGHLLVIHDPTRTAGPRFNLAAGVDNVSDARTIAEVLVPTAPGDNKFWSDSAAALLAACLIRFPTLGDVFNALRDVKALAETLATPADDAALLANAFRASVHADGKLAANVVATLATALTGWAAAAVRANTAAGDFDAGVLVGGPGVVVLTCPGRMRAVYAPYLGATLRKLMLDLDSLGEAQGGPLPRPVGVILDEFPTLGRLAALVADVNLVRKRRISILIGAQTKGQFHLLYGAEGTQALFSGLATQIVFGGCDAETARFYSQAAGTATSEARGTPVPRGRPLLTVDEVITPQRGNCTVFARYVAAGFATQVIFHARLTRFYERQDWRQRLQAAADRPPILLERGPELTGAPDTPAASFDNRAAMVQLLAQRHPELTLTDLAAMRQQLGGVR